MCGIQEYSRSWKSSVKKRGNAMEIYTPTRAGNGIESKYTQKRSLRVYALRGKDPTVTFDSGTGLWETACGVRAHPATGRGSH